MSERKRVSVGIYFIATQNMKRQNILKQLFLSIDFLGIRKYWILYKYIILVYAADDGNIL